ncbi:MAG: hypothetical protein AAGL90_02040 [Pseudomonadota bacterium]
MRKFRDTWLAQQPGGTQDIKRYYQHAPAIAEKLSLDPRRMTRLYFTGLLPSALTAKLGMNKTARWKTSKPLGSSRIGSKQGSPRAGARGNARPYHCLNASDWL